MSNAPIEILPSNPTGYAPNPTGYAPKTQLDTPQIRLDTPAANPTEYNPKWQI